ncbi:LysR family transcriptional regulator [Roseibium salinum]|nr:LysR family transcriptional regulator [Roseibium salinum]
MNWDDLKLIDAAARHRSLSGAAKALNLSQPQLSRRLKGFEERIGARLFDRTPTGLKPTEAGARLIPPWRRKCARRPTQPPGFFPILPELR